ncbi:similar to Saccharomyces cerevisiae YNL038W GPI15 Protein involved in the synthesis of N-acetylglucosaminyl phosphatidylinositol (GlcNAc-PI) [Maudiozyma barnettii]|uniref:Similar to Saccharomyces cerevisiae YNL038W GPI15 Protein involved in the synthesis of N-acetylglucosaminyl phosphatidylinositol (GlcNAc-PI) n=1 Tax=Maudiozyma barnettii TaxID=61262 RepID=A0A8H2ZFX1_9SACH|nr:phosphatidylinositol N-acetylglucosaminyltransferase GPI15 [Kazachstania barnettii]CAB4252805.1 similar to Saccharomyces cerevisiae YNL038W GPI15 Protein involved in the synthesis of N-acetylglucosaminyl phosphatidylinositol (GlcNAc-PI) [Kazachstania barnettii]CAD1780595.1 similar to Saccharomyces cerevisiae YNL038W GPI15 Protein involved in the synthesis of N-acetylglucosaminyl phosphatidylinositol (GlcNAc-PI) [Kazachstania barnettii]
MPKSFKNNISVRRKRYTINIEREIDDNYVSVQIIPNGLRKKQLINCIIVVIFNAWIILPEHTFFESFTTYIVLIKSLIFLFSCMILKNPTIERLTIFKNCGIQTSEISGLSVLPDTLNNIICSPRATFIPKDRIVDVIINEGFVKECQVIFYLAAILRGQNKLKLLFSNNRPRLVDQKTVYNLVRKCLYLKHEPLLVE